MACDIVAALGRATTAGTTLFGQNTARPSRASQSLTRTPGRACGGGEKVRTQYLELPQARETCTVLGSQPGGHWGYDHGVNGYQVAVGCAPLRPAFAGPGPGLTGTDLVRLTLERSRSARQAFDLLTDLVSRHGQGAPPDCPAEEAHDHAFLIADGREAFAVETAGKYWVCQEIQEVRAVSDVRVVRQDWDGIARGLAGEVIAKGLWPEDGSKLDFAGALGHDPHEHTAALRRWGRATLLLEQQNGHIDVSFLRRILGDHFEETDEDRGPWRADEPAAICRHAAGRNELATTASLVAQLGVGPGRLFVVWCAFGPPCCGVYFPLFPDAELPPEFADGGPTGLWARFNRLQAQLHSDPELVELVHERLTSLQVSLDLEAEEFVQEEGAVLKEKGAVSDLHRLTALFLEHTLERCDEVLAGLTRRSPAVVLA